MNVAHKKTARQRKQVPQEAVELTRTQTNQDWYHRYPDLHNAEELAQLYRNRKAVSAIDFAQPPSFAGPRHASPRAPHAAPRKSVAEQPRNTLASIALFALIAIGGGSATGYLAAHPEVLGGTSSAVTASTGTLDTSPFASLAAYAQRLLPGEAEKNTGITASVRVKDVFGRANSTIPLGLESVADANAINYRISGVPEAVALTSGIDLGKGNWIVKAKDLPNLGLVADHHSGDLSLRVTALAQEDVMPEVPVKELTVTVAEADPIVIDPSKKKGRALAKLNKLASDAQADPEVDPQADPQADPMLAEGDPGVAAEGKGEPLEIVPASAPPQSSLKTE
jgi:hypothetical protein